MQNARVVGKRFQLETQVGSGGMATVHLAIDRLTGQRVALKLLRREVPEHAERFEREARLLSDIDHPRVVRYVDSGITDAGAPWLAMEWLEGETLAERLARKGLTVAETMQLAIRVTEPLAVLHQRGVVHRDLKPGNLMLRDGEIERVCLLDFGIARAMAGVTGITNTGAMLGTPGYLAPEQARGERVDARADVFALGCVLFKCLTGRLPLPGDDVLAAMLRLVLEDAPRVRELVDAVPDDIDELVGRMLQRDPAARPADAVEVARLLVDVSLAPDPEEGRPSAVAVLTGSERRTTCLLIARPRDGHDDDEATTRIDGAAPPDAQGADGLREDVMPRYGEALTTQQRRANRYHGALDVLADGTVLVAFVEARGASATDLAARAARCALDVRERWRDLGRACIVTGRSVAEARASLGEAIAEGVRLLGRATSDAVSPAIRLDSVTASLLERSFHVDADEHGPLLVGGATGRRPVPTLLGKPTPLVGRARELAHVEALFAETVDESAARPVIVTAPAGIGKTRFCQEVVAAIRLRWPEVELWRADGDPISRGSPFGMLAPLVRRAAGIQDGEPAEVRRDKLIARVGRHLRATEVARVVEFVAELASVPASEATSVELAAARRDPQLMGDQMMRAWLRWTAVECDAHPLLLVLEDLQWGDLPTVAFVDAALRSCAERRLFVLAFGRPEVHDAFPELWSSRRVQEIRLDPLSRAASERLARVALGEPASDETVARVVDLAGGNAFYLEELVRAVAAGATDSLPDTVLAMAEARIEALDPAARRMLRAASVFGQVFWRGGVVALAGAEAPARAVPAILETLTLAEVLTRRTESRFPDEAEYAFRHVLVRDAAYAMLTEPDRQLGHRLAGRWLERVGESDTMVLAEHCERGARHERAAGLYLRAAQQALEGDDPSTALSRSEHALPYARHDPQLAGELLLVAVHVHGWRGELAPMQERALEALRQLRPGSGSWFVAAGSAITASGRSLDRATAARAIDLVDHAVPDSARSAAQRCEALAHAVTHLCEVGAHDDAARMLAVLETAAAQVSDDVHVQAWLARARGWRGLVAGEMSVFEVGMRTAAAAFDVLGDARRATSARMNAAFAAMMLGAYEQAEAGLLHALRDAERLQVLHIVAAAHHNLGLVIALQGRADEGRAHEEKAIAELERHGETKMLADARRYLAKILVLANDLAGAEREVRFALPQASLAQRVALLGVLAALLLRLDRSLEARSVALEGIRELESLGGVVAEGEAELRLALAEAHEAEGNHAAASAALARAKERLLARADKISDADVKKTFLEAVRENARTLALATEWGI